MLVEKSQSPAKQALPEERNCLHNQHSQLEGHILVINQGHQRPQLQTQRHLRPCLITLPYCAFRMLDTQNIHPKSPLTNAKPA